MEDTDIIQLYWARDEGAIAATDEKYGTLCRSLSHNILASREDAEECVNDTWHRAWNTMPPQRPALPAGLSGPIGPQFVHRPLAGPEEPEAGRRAGGAGTGAGGLCASRPQRRGGDRGAGALPDH